MNLIRAFNIPRVCIPIALAMTLVGVASSFGLAAENCQSIFLPPTVSDASKLIELPQVRVIAVNEEVVHFVTGIKEPRFMGGHLRILRSDTGRWSSRYSVIGNDPAGDPRFLVEILGSRTAYHLGFRSYGHNEITAPDAEALSGVVKAINTRLIALRKAPIPLSFYEVNILRPLSGEMYLEHFVEGSLPLEKSGSLGIHDISYHTSAILLPDEIVSRLQLSAEFMLRFVQYLKTNKSIEQTGMLGKLKSLFGRGDFINSQDGRDAVTNDMIDLANSRIDLLGNVSTMMSGFITSTSGSIDFAKFQSANSAANMITQRMIEDTGMNQSPFAFVGKILLLTNAPRSVYMEFKKFAQTQPDIMSEDPEAISAQSLRDKIHDRANLLVNILQSPVN